MHALEITVRRALRTRELAAGGLLLLHAILLCPAARAAQPRLTAFAPAGPATSPCATACAALGSGPARCLPGASLAAPEDGSSCGEGGAESGAPVAVPLDLDALEREGAVIAAIRIESVAIFDPSIREQSGAAFRAVNRLHVETRENTIRQELLFKEGDPFNRARLEETERNLRSLSFIQDATVEVENAEGGRVFVRVRTQDSWTTHLGARFGSSGGSSSAGINLTEGNLLGRGKKFELQYVNGIDRTTKGLLYQDPNLFGSRYRLRVRHEDSSDGRGDGLSFSLPFFSLETPLAYGIDFARNQDRFSLFHGGEFVQSFAHETRDGNVWLGWANSIRKGSVARWTVGYSYEDNQYDDSGSVVHGLPSEDVPSSRVTAGPFVEYTRIRKDFIKVRYVERFSRNEDYNLGGSINFRLQAARESLGASANEMVYSLGFSKGARTGFASYLLGSALIKGRLGGSEQGSGHFDVTHYYTAWPKQTLVFRIQADRSVNQEAANRYSLGGDTGLRGYRLRRFDGTNRLLLNVEDRIHFEREFFQLFRLGSAFFLDVGNAWGGTRTEQQRVCGRDASSGKVSCPFRVVSVENGFGNFKADVGFALLADVARASAAGFMRFNVAFPINGNHYDQATILVSYGRSGGF